MRKIRLHIIILLPIGLLTIFLPLDKLISGALFLLFFIIDYILIQKVIKNNSVDIKDSVIDNELEDISNDIKQVDIQVEETNTITKDYTSDLLKVDECFKELYSHMDLVDNKDSITDLDSLTKEFLPYIEDASNNSYAIKGSVTQIFTISDNLAKTTQTAFDLAKNVQDSIAFVSDKLTKAVSVTEDLDAKSAEISSILDIMSNISSMVHILSINASIVSARAGIHGEGFKVVAKEIRNLAVNTDKSLSDIDVHVKDVQDAVKNVAVEINEAGKAIEQESQELINVAGALQGVLLSVEIINTVSGAAKDTTENQTQSFVALKESLDRLLVYLKDKFDDNHTEMLTCKDNIKRITTDIHGIFNDFSKEGL